MSAEGFTQHGYRGALLYQEPLPKHYYGGHIRIFDIGDEGLFGAWYPDNARVAAPRAWFPRAQRAYEQMSAQGKLYAPTLDGTPPEEQISHRTGNGVLAASPPSPQQPRADASEVSPVSVARSKLKPRNVK